jgi:hypothetical protein
VDQSPLARNFLKRLAIGVGKEWGLVDVVVQKEDDIATTKQNKIRDVVAKAEVRQ